MNQFFHSLRGRCTGVLNQNYKKRAQGVLKTFPFSPPFPLSHMSHVSVCFKSSKSTYVYIHKEKRKASRVSLQWKGVRPLWPHLTPLKTSSYTSGRPSRGRWYSPTKNEQRTYHTHYKYEFR